MEKQISIHINSFSAPEKEIVKKASNILGFKRSKMYHNAIVDFSNRIACKHKANPYEKMFIRKMLDDDTLFLPMELEDWMKGEVAND